MTGFLKTRTALRSAYQEQSRICRLRLRDLRNLQRHATDDESLAAITCAIETERRMLRTMGELESTIERIGGTVQ